MTSKFLLVVCLVILFLNNANSKEIKRKEKAEKKNQVVCQKQMSIFPVHAHYHQCKPKVITVILIILIIINSLLFDLIVS